MHPMRITGFLLTTGLSAVLAQAGGGLMAASPRHPAQDIPLEAMIAKVEAALPLTPPAAPKAERQILIFTLTRGYRHSSIPIGVEALRRLGDRTGAYLAETSDDPDLFKPERLARFDAVIMLNTTGELFDDPALKESVLDFVRSGKGWVGIHAATDCFYAWPEYGEMIGGYFDGHPWHESVTLKIDDPEHPLCAAFNGRPLTVTDEIYQFRYPYSRSRLRVLTSLDTSRTDMKKEGIRRVDGDFAVSWVRTYGKGRVFNCSLGHREEIFWNPTVLRHYLAGIQYAVGDLKADAAPSLERAPGWKRLFNGENLNGWKGLVADPPTRAKMTTEELEAAQAKADELMRAHWKVEDGVLVFDGQGSHLCTRKDYSNFELLVDWKIEPGGDSGIYLRGCPQVQIWDPAQGPVGSGGLYNNEKHPKDPKLVADNPVGQWNTFYIRMMNDRVTVRLNDQLVVDDVVLENYWERDKPIYASGPIELQSHGSKLWFRNLWIREIPPGSK